MTSRSVAASLFEKRPATAVEMDLDYCGNTFGVAPCTAGRKDSGTARAKSALEFKDVTSQFVSKAAPVGFSNSAMSVEMWAVMRAGGDFFALTQSWVASTGGWLFGWTNANQPFFGVSDAAHAQHNALGNVALIAGQKVHLVGVYDGATVKLYVYGVLQTTTAALVLSTIDTTASVSIGWRGNQVGEDAVADGVRVYARALSSTEPLEHFNGIYSNEAGLVLHWELDEGSGVVAADSSGNGNDGALSGPPTWFADPNVAITMRLRAAASSVNNAYNGMTVRITGGTGSGQERKILDYDGGARVAWLTSAWTTNPDATSTYDIIDRANGCYNVFAGDSPCQNQPNFTRTTKTIKFINRGATPPVGTQLRPYLMSSKVTPTTVDPVKGLSVRSNTELIMADEPARDDLDLYVDSRVTPADGTYWRRLIARNPNAVGRFTRVRRGFVTSPWDWTTFQDELYLIESITGPSAEDTIKVVLSDAVKLLDRNKLPVPTNGKLSADMKSAINSGSVVSATATTVVLASAASSVDSFYNGNEIFIFGGTGIGQRRVITAYVGLTRTATVAAWALQPDATSFYEVTPLSFNVGTGLGAQYADPVATGKPQYVSVRDEVIRYSSIVGDVLNLADGTYRAQFGTTRADHKANDGVQQCMYWSGATATQVVHDLLNLGGLSDTYIDTTGLASEESQWFGVKALITACIASPETASSLLADLLQDLNMMVWWSPVDQKVRFKVNMPEVSSTIPTLTDDKFIKGSVDVTREDAERVTRSALSYDVISATANRKEPISYRTTEIFISAPFESANGYGDKRSVLRQSRWLTSAANSVYAAAVVSRRLIGLLDAPYTVEGKIDPKDEVALGSLVNVATRKLTSAAGTPRTIQCRVVKVTDNGESQDLELRSTTFGRRYAFICPNGYPDYPTADSSQRSRAFIASGITGTMSDGSSAYLII